MYSCNDYILVSYQISKISVESLHPSKGLVELMVLHACKIQLSTCAILLLGASCYAQLYLDNKLNSELLCHSYFYRNAKYKQLLPRVQQLKA